MAIKYYTTVQGDMWDGIAYSILGSESFMSQLIEANPAYNDIVIFPANIIISIPDIALPDTLNVPPWKRGEV